jgi:ribosomal-protein-serine acetyltransferase
MKQSATLFSYFPDWKKAAPIRLSFRTGIRQRLWSLVQKPAPELEVDPEILLRPLRLSETEQVFRLVQHNRKHLRAWLNWVNHVNSAAETRRFMMQINYRDIYSGRWVYGIWYQDRMVGLIDFNEGVRELRQVSIGYWLSEEYQRKGIVTRACMRCIDFAFREKGVRKILIKCASGNFRSQAVPQRLNFQWEGIERESGTLNGKPVDMVIFALRYQDWVN